MVQAAKYVFLSAFIVSSLFLGSKLAFSKRRRRGAWRSTLERRGIVIERKAFKAITKVAGYSLIAIGILLAILQTLKLVFST